MARKKQTAKKTGGESLKAPRKQLKSKKNNNQKKTAEQVELLKIQLRKTRKETVLYVEALNHYDDDGYELPMPPSIKKLPTEDDENIVMGRPKLEARQCGICFKKFCSLLGWKNHMPYHHRGCGHKCGFCLEAMKKDKTIKLEDCWFATREAAVKHLSRKHKIKIGPLSSGTELIGAYKKNNMTKPENTKELQEKLATVYVLAYDLPQDLKFNQLQMKITGDKKYDHPMDYGPLTTIPEDAVEPAEVEQYIIPFGDDIEYKVKPGTKQYQIFEESGGCFDFEKLHKKRGGSYDSKYLRILIQAKEYQFGFTRAAYAKCEVANIEKEFPDGCDRENVKKYRIEWMGYDERTVEKIENLNNCGKMINKFWKYKELEREMNTPVEKIKKTRKNSKKKKTSK